MRAVGLSVTLATLAGASSASAEGDVTATLELGYFEHHASELYSIYEDVYTATPRLEVMLTERVSLAGSLAFAHLRDRNAPGNLVIGVRYRKDRGAFAYRLGLDVGLPTSDVVDDFDANQALLGAGVGHGHWELWRWAYGWSAVALPAELTWSPAGGQLRLEAAIAYGTSSGDVPLPGSPLVQAAVGYTRSLVGCLSVRARGGVVAMSRHDQLVLDRFVEAAVGCELPPMRVELVGLQPWIDNTAYSAPSVALRAELEL